MVHGKFCICGLSHHLSFFVVVLFIITFFTHSTYDTFVPLFISYAFLVHGRGPAVGDFGFDLARNTTLTSSRITISGNTIDNIRCWTNEVPGKKKVKLEGKVKTK